MPGTLQVCFDCRHEPECRQAGRPPPSLRIVAEPTARAAGLAERRRDPAFQASYLRSYPIALQASGFQTGCFAETPSAAAGRLPASLRTLADPLAGVRPLHLVCCASVTSLMLCRLHSSSEQPEPAYYC